MACKPLHRQKSHVLTVGLEDFCHATPLNNIIPSACWPHFESRLWQNTLVTLDLLDRVGAKATFFVLGWIGDHHPEIVAEVVRRGHEIASAGYYHRRLAEMSVEEFRQDVRRSREALERAGGSAVKGYRIGAGWFSPPDLWALNVLAEEGFAYDSSLRPLGPGLRNEPFRRFIHEHHWKDLKIWEAPISTASLAGFCVPIGGGNFVRQFPHSLMMRAVDRWHRTVPYPLVFYFHVWELDPHQPRIASLSRLQRLRQYRNLEKMAGRIPSYLTRYRFSSIADFLDLPTPSTGTSLTKAATTHTKVVEPSRSEEYRSPVTIVVPLFNEEMVLGFLANTLRGFTEAMSDQYEVSYVFVDDGSNDRTWEQLQQRFAEQPNTQLVRHRRNQGVAAATLTGIAHAKTEIVCVIDSDLTYDPSHLREMIPMLTDDVCLVTASPYHRSGRVFNCPRWRLLLSRTLSLLYCQVLHHKLATYTACFRVYRRSAIDGLLLECGGFVGIAELLARIDLSGRKIVEYPTILTARLLGQSKMRTNSVIRGHLFLIFKIVKFRVLERLVSAK